MTMCGQYDDPSQHPNPPTDRLVDYPGNSTVTLTPPEKQALRTYMNGLDRWAAEQMGVDPNLICSACGYVSHDEPTGADNAHDNLCCGGVGVCHDFEKSKVMCVTHDTMPAPGAFR